MRELTVSLKTTNFPDAKRKDIREALRVIDLFALASRYQRGEVGEEVVSLLRSVEEIEADTIAALLTKGVRRAASDVGGDCFVLGVEPGPEVP